MSPFARIAIVAVSLSLDVFAVGVGVGVGRPPLAQRLRIGAAFGLAEVAMCAIGVGIGHIAGELIGAAAAYFGFSVLFALGVYTMYESRREARTLDLSSGWGLILAAISVSLDSLGIGFTLPYLDVPLPASLATVFVTSVASTAVGLWLGSAVGAKAGASAGFAAGAILCLTGAGFALMRAYGLGG